MHLWDYLGGHERIKQTWRKVKWNVSVGLKQLKQFRSKRTYSRWIRLAFGIL